VLLKSYGKQLAAGLGLLAIVVLLRRRRRST
jgi:MYXO-CTERM domain-containing protein